MPEAVIVDAVRTPIGRAFKGALAGLRPDDTGAYVIDQLLERNPDVSPESVEEVIAGCGLAAGPPGLQHRPHHGAAVRAAAGLGQRRDRLALLRLEPRGDPPGGERGPRRRGRHLHRGRRRVGQPLQRAPGGGRRRRPEREAPGQQRSAERLHLDGPHGRERGRQVGGQPRRHGQVRAALPGAGGRLAGERVLRPRDRAGDAARRHRGRAGTRARGRARRWRSSPS